MNQESLTKIAFEISTSLAALNANMEQVLAKLTDHEARLHELEQYEYAPLKDDTFKTELLKLLAKSTIIGLVVICSLTGAGGLISKILGL